MIAEWAKRYLERHGWAVYRRSQMQMLRATFDPNLGENFEQGLAAIAFQADRSGAILTAQGGPEEDPWSSLQLLVVLPAGERARRAQAEETRTAGGPGSVGAENRTVENLYGRGGGGGGRGSADAPTLISHVIRGPLDLTGLEPGRDFVFMPLPTAKSNNAAGQLAVRSECMRNIQRGDSVILPNGDDTARYRFLSYKFDGSEGKGLVIFEPGA